MWATILKRNPIPANKQAWVTAIAGALSTGETGVERISSMVSAAMEDDAKRTRQTVNIVNDLKGLDEEELGEQFSLSGNNLENLVNGLEELSEALSEIVVETPQSDSLIANFNKAMESLEQGNTEDLVDYLKGGPKTWSGDKRPGRVTRTQRLKMLEDKEPLIREKTEGNIELWYYDLSDNTITLPKGGKKELETELEGLEDTYTLKDNILTFPEKISLDQWKELEEPLSVLVTNLKVPKPEVKSSPLLQVFPEKQIDSNVQARTEQEFENKNYTNLISRDNILDYFKLTVKQGWPTKLLLPELPEESPGNKNDVLNTVYIGRSVLPPVVKVLLSTHTFNLSSMMDEGASIQETKLIPEKVIQVLIDNELPKELELDPDDIELTLQDISDLSGEYHNRALIEEEGREKHYSNRFIRWLNKGSPSATRLKPKYEELVSKLKSQRPLMLFSEQEAKDLWGLSEYKPFNEENMKAFREGLRQIYSTRRVRPIIESLKDILNAADEFQDMFVQVEQQYKLNSNLRLQVPPRRLSRFIQRVQRLRKSKTQKQVNEEDRETDPIKIIQAVHKETGTDLDWDETYSPHHVTPQDILQALIYLDYWYSEGKLNEFKNDYLDAISDEAENKNDILVELIDACEEQFSNVMDSITEQVKSKVDDIIEEPNKYIERMSKKSKIYHLSGPLIDAGIIREE